MPNDLRQHFYLDPSISYMNHGSFGACPIPVMKSYQDWQIELEKNPIDYFVRQLRGLFSKDAQGPLEDARNTLAKYVGADPTGLIFTPNVTVALNAIAFSMPLEAGDEVLTTDHEYGTIDATWVRKCQKHGATMKRVPVSLPVGSQEAFVDSFWSYVTPRTRVILMSHITSATALKLPIEEICKRARIAGITTVIDGAHAVGQLDLDLIQINADFYTSNCHKWLLTPKGTAFLYVHPSQRERFEPMVISWAEINQPSFSLRHEMWGTRDMAAFLAIPAALEFRREHDWESQNLRSRQVVREYRIKFAKLCERDLICDESWLGQLASVLLPGNGTTSGLWKYLWEQHRIEAMVTQWQTEPILRLGFNAYNDISEMDALFSAVAQYLKSPS